ncbi:hypothetical protein HCUR_00563 [Holospora curviuscula]|uniref:Uncharacterized protein n=1 Tax=Holospora curviuscula TaxID=1082868 RepID=A0A2S5R9P1_9PROT|nr:hypothetical protein HCUR_00563 [Holospora curviuscula]
MVVVFLSDFIISKSIILLLQQSTKEYLTTPTKRLVPIHIKTFSDYFIYPFSISMRGTRQLLKVTEVAILKQLYRSGQPFMMFRSKHSHSNSVAIFQRIIKKIHAEKYTFVIDKWSEFFSILPEHAFHTLLKIR